MTLPSAFFDQTTLRIVRGLKWPLVGQTAEWTFLFGPPGAELPLDLTQYTATLKIRTTIDAATAVVTLTETDGLTLTTDSKVSAKLTASQTADLVGNAYDWDLVLYEPDYESGEGRAMAALEGKATVQSFVSRA